MKFTDGGAHISRTMMLPELQSLLDAVPVGSPPDAYATAVVTSNVLGKRTVSTRQKTLRHLRELYGMSESIPLFALLRRLDQLDPSSRPALALQVAWARDPLLRATTRSIMDAEPGTVVGPTDLAESVQSTFPQQYSELNCNKIARNAASTWTQSGHLVGRTKKLRRMVVAPPVAVTMALYLGTISGYRGVQVFSNPWIRLLDLNSDRARALAQVAHRAGFLNLRSVGDVIELSFPSLSGATGLDL